MAQGSNRHNKGLSFSRSKRKIPRVNNVIIGTHVSRIHDEDPASQDSSTLKSNTFSSPKKAQRAKRGMVDHITPDTKTGESHEEAQRRRSRPEYAEKLARNARVKGWVIGLSVALTVGIIAAIVGAVSYVGSVSDRMGLGESNAREALAVPEENQAYYMLVVAEFFDSAQEDVGPRLLSLVRIDQHEKKVTILSIPSNLQWQMPDGSYKRIAESQLMGGDAALIDAVSDLVGVPIAHFVKTDRNGFVALVDSLGGIEVEVSEEVDDPRAGAIYIPEGTQTLNGEEALVLCRAKNFINEEEVRANHQNLVLLALFQKLLDANPIQLVIALDGIAPGITTDFSAMNSLGLVSSLKGIDKESVFLTRVPGSSSTSTVNEVKYYYMFESAWKAIKDTFIAGEKPLAASSLVETVDPASFTITIKNGSSATGAAREMADLLTGKGFVVPPENVGNADQFVYNETLVVYKDQEHLAAAETVVAALGVGRAIPSNWHYAFETDVLIMLGKDWKPLN